MATNQPRPQDDSDMKIALPGKQKSHSAETEEVRRTLDEVQQVQEAGVLQKAADAGRQMAAAAAALCAADDALASQRVWLWVFGVTVGCERSIDRPVVARTVLNAFHNAFREQCAASYEDSGYSLALSFYYLAVRSGDRPRQEIGRTFAMLCGDEQNAAWQQAGVETYDRCLAQMQDLAKALNEQEKQA